MNEKISPLKVCESFLPKSVLPLHRELKNLPGLPELKALLRNGADSLNGNVDGIAYRFEQCPDFCRNVVTIRNGDNSVIIIYNTRYDIVSVQCFDGNPDVCKNMIHILEHLIPA